MNKIKKALLLAMSLAMSACLFVGCFTNPDDSSTKDSVPETSSTESVTSETPATSDEETSETPAESVEDETSETPVADTEAPVFSDVDETQFANLAPGATITIPTVTATDNVDSEVVIYVTFGNAFRPMPTQMGAEIELTYAGEYAITYSATDAAGNYAEKKIAVSVVCEHDFSVGSIDADYVDPMYHWVQCSKCGEKDLDSVAEHVLLAKSNETTTWDECECGYKTNFDDNDITSSIAYLDRYNKYLLKADGTSIKANKGNYWDGAENIVTVENQSEVKYGENSGYAMKIGFDLSKFTEEQLTEATTEATSSWADWDKKQLWVAYAIPVEALNLNTVTITLDAKFDNMDQQIALYAAQNAPEGAEYVYAVGAEYTIKQANATELGDGWYRYTYTVKSTYAVDKAADYIVLSLSNTNAETTDTTKPSYVYIDNVAITDRECAHDSETATAATCAKAAFCDLCDKSFGEVDADAHEKEVTVTDNGDTHTMKYECCGAVVEENVAHEGAWVVGEGKDVLTCKCGKEMATFLTANATETTVNFNIEDASQTNETLVPVISLFDEAILTQENLFDLCGFRYGDITINILLEENLEYFAENEDGDLCLHASLFGYSYGKVTLTALLLDASFNPDSEDLEGAIAQAIHEVPITLNLITNVIETKEELDNFLFVAKAFGDAEADTYGGYFVLGQDIVYNENAANLPEAKTAATLPNIYVPPFTGAATGGFVGVFDGQGYAIDGFLMFGTAINDGVVSGAFIPEIAPEGVLKNVAFTNAVVGAGPMITNENNGLIENVYVQVHAFGIYYSQKWNMFKYYNPGQCGTEVGFFNNTWNATGTINNVFIDLTDSAKKTYIEAGKNEGESWHDDFGINPDTAEIVDSNGNKHYANKFYGLGKVGSPVYAGVYLVGMPTAAIWGQPEHFNKVEKACSYADLAAFATAYNAENSALAAEIATWPVWLSNLAKPSVELNNVEVVDLGISVNSGSLVQSDATATIDLSEIGENIGALVSVTWNGKALSATLSGTTLSVPVAQFGYEFGESNLTVIVEKGKYSLPVILATKVLNTAADVDAFDEIAIAMGNLVYNATNGKMSTGYFTLGQNISYNGTYVAAQARGSSSSLGWDAGTAAGFAGVFDGCGYTIDGMTVGSSTAATSNAAFITLLHADGIIRNVGFTNATIDNAGCGGFVIGVGQGLIENVYVQLVAVPHYSVVGGIAATDNARCVSGPTVRNVFVDSSAFTTNTVRVYAIGGTSGDVCNNTTGASGADEVTDTFGIYDSVYALVADLGETNHQLTNAFGAGGAYSAVNTGAYVSAEAMKADTAAQAELATWNTAYWTIGENGVPVWNSAK